MLQFAVLRTIKLREARCSRSLNHTSSEEASSDPPYPVREPLTRVPCAAVPLLPLAQENTPLGYKPLPLHHLGDVTGSGAEGGCPKAHVEG